MQFTLVRAIPKKFCTQWVDLLTDIALEKMIDTTMENEARRVFKRYRMVKASLMTFVRGGERRRNCSANLAENLISAFLRGGEEDHDKSPWRK